MRPWPSPVDCCHGELPAILIDGLRLASRWSCWKGEVQFVLVLKARRFFWLIPVQVCVDATTEARYQGRKQRLRDNIHALLVLLLQLFVAVIRWHCARQRWRE